MTCEYCGHEEAHRYESAPWGGTTVSWTESECTNENCPADAYLCLDEECSGPLIPTSPHDFACFFCDARYELEHGAFKPVEEGIKNEL